MELTVTGLVKEFQDSRGDPGFLLELPELALVAGGVNFLMGHNGSGKSVLLRLLAGETLPKEGKVSIQQEDRVWNPGQEAVGIVRQQASQSLAMELSILENFIVRRRIRGIGSSLFPVKSLQAEIEKILEPYLEIFLKRYEKVEDLSVGQRQTVAFLAVAQQRSSLLLLDEFLAATDYETSRRLQRLAKQYAQETPAAALIVSHDIELALAEADRIVILRRGRLVQSLDPEDPSWNESSLAELLSAQQARVTQDTDQ